MQKNTNIQRQSQPRRSRQGAGHRNNGNRHMADELMGMLDEHLAWNAARERGRPSSAGTMIVDWDGTGTPVISYQKDESDVVPQAQAEQTAKVPQSQAVRAQREHGPKPQREREHTVQPRSQTHTQASRAKSRPQRTEVSQSIQPLRSSTAHVPSQVPVKQVPGNYKSSRNTSHSQTSHSSSGQPQPPFTVRRKPVPECPRASNPSSRHYTVLSGSSSAPHGHPATRDMPPPRPHYHSAPETQHAPNSSRARIHSTAVHTHHSPSPQDLSVDYNPTHNTARGYDPATSFTYDYNWQIVHVHRSPTQSSHSNAIRYSEYYNVPAETYSATASVTLVDKELPALARASLTHETTKRGKVVAFVKDLLHKLDGMSVLWKMRQEREKKKVEMWRRRVGMETCF